MIEIVERLTRQLAAKGNKNARKMAIHLLKKQGSLDKDGNLTKHGEKRNKMSPSDRAKERQARYSGNSPSDYNYDPDTNRATKRKDD